MARPRNRVLSWISGEYPDEGGAVAEAGALAPPDAAVRREILRLELEAEVANLQAESDALLSEAAAEGRVPVRLAADVVADAPGEAVPADGDVELSVAQPEPTDPGTPDEGTRLI